MKDKAENGTIKFRWQYLVVYILIASLISYLLIDFKIQREKPKVNEKPSRQEVVVTKGDFDVGFDVDDEDVEESLPEDLTSETETSETTTDETTAGETTAKETTTKKKDSGTNPTKKPEESDSTSDTEKHTRPTTNPTTTKPITTKPTTTKPTTTEPTQTDPVTQSLTETPVSD